jgi:23S rRNA (guanine2445-N2)-methyltransferase / 23S rRNA (guanine2069-N7)-methyltransferase
MIEEEKWRHQAAMLVNRIQKRVRKLKSWVRTHQITCYRLYDRDIPEIPLIVDRYEGQLHISVFENQDRWDRGERWLAVMTDALKQAFDLDDKELFLKQRRRAEGGTQYRPMGRQGKLLPVNESGLTFWVNLEDYVDTGLFLDHRKTRGMVREMSSGLRVLNLFAYTGTFSVYAAAGGAETVTTVDLSNTYLEWARKNMETNGYSGDRYRYVRDDILDALTARRMTGTYDLVVLDPPTVSKSKQMARAFDIQRDHVVMLNRLLERLSLDGVIVFSSNYKRFKLQDAEIKGANITEITGKTIARDFEGRPGHRCWRIEKRGL